MSVSVQRFTNHLRDFGELTLFTLPYCISDFGYMLTSNTIRCQELPASSSDKLAYLINQIVLPFGFAAELTTQGICRYVMNERLTIHPNGHVLRIVRTIPLEVETRVHTFITRMIQEGKANVSFPAGSSFLFLEEAPAESLTELLNRNLPQGCRVEVEEGVASLSQRNRNVAIQVNGVLRLKLHQPYSFTSLERFKDYLIRVGKFIVPIGEELTIAGARSITEVVTAINESGRELAYLSSQPRETLNNGFLTLNSNTIFGVVASALPTTLPQLTRLNKRQVRVQMAPLQMLQISDVQPSEIDALIAAAHITSIAFKRAIEKLLTEKFDHSFSRVALEWIEPPRLVYPLQITPTTLSICSPAEMILCLSLDGPEK